jgi:glycosyltransferase involved in cell wall biosynthesis
MLGAVDRHAAAVVAATPAIAARYANPRTVVVGNEARFEVFSACKPSFAAGRVLFTGHVGPSQLFDRIVAAVASIPSVSLMVAGRQPERDAWAAAEARLGQRITHLGWLNRSGLAAAMDRASLGLCTYADIPTNAENSPNKIFEFCAAGLPVVASPNLSNRRLMRECGGGFLAEGFSAEAISEAIRTGLSDVVAWQFASQRGREWASRKGSWKESEQRLLDLYDQVLVVR